MYRRRSIPWAVLVLCGSLVGFARAQTEGDAAKSAPVDLTGSWKWDFTSPDNNTMEFSLKLNWDGKQLTGKYTAFDNTTDIEDVKLENSDLSFLSKREFNGNEFTVHFNGKAEPDDIVGTVGVDFGEGPQEFEWHAKRVVEIDDVLGTWNLRLESPNGVIEPQITITKEGDSLYGTYVSRFGEREPKDLKLKDNELSWEISSDEDDDFDFKFVYRGKPRGNSIQGTNEFDFGGNTGTMDFTGKRTPPAEEKPAEAKPAEPAAAATPASAATPPASQQ